MYMQNYKCQVTGSTSTKKLSTPKPPVYCGDDSSKCVKGAKQMIAWHRKLTGRLRSGRSQVLTSPDPQSSMATTSSQRLASSQDTIRLPAMRLVLRTTFSSETRIPPHVGHGRHPWTYIPWCFFIRISIFTFGVCFGGCSVHCPFTLSFG